MADTKTIINTRKHNLRTEHLVMLRPGENVVGAEKAATLAKSKAAQAWFTMGWIRVAKAPRPAGLAAELAGGDEGAGEPEASGAMSARDAIAAAAAETDMAVLESMLEGEDRKTVVKAIDDRMIELLDAAGGAGGDDEGAGESDDAGEA